MFTSTFRFIDPFRDLDAVHRQIGALLRDSFEPPRGRAGTPAFDLFDAGEHYQLVADVPGLAEGDVDLEVSAETVTVRGRRKLELPEGFEARHRERADLQFSRTFTLPTRIDPERASAALDKGVLRVTLHKRSDERPRSITVKSGL